MTNTQSAPPKKMSNLFRLELYSWFFFFFKEKELHPFIFNFFFYILNCIFVEFYLFLDTFLGVFDCMVEKIGFEKVCLKLKE